ncbi:SDR family NAD(P)-dependent oxidoreductase [Roseobacter sp. GAI101]|uniref:SDR family NAD(P)-dependent oxidoreductase n=1 Tax=Roseobacter sp. (strain GAI101) TaxID=391589 RepID=UPI0001871A4D|nr:SDR family oxidoreductase [Roseobacter sp. GAI101]EEB82525.1 short-chain dehydrogenase/reductase SDR [Roseobacter sp. GAI101]
MMKRLTSYFWRTRPIRAVEPIYRPAPTTAFFAGQTAVIAGGAGKIGAAITRELLGQDSDVIVIDRCADALWSLADAEANPRLRTIQLDLTDAEGVRKLDLQACDILVLAAGVQFETDLFCDTDKQWSDSFQTNILAPARLTRTLIPHLKKNGGSIIMVTSIHAMLPSRWANYGAAKAAQAAMVREWAVDLAPHDIRVNAIAPGWVHPDDQVSKLSLLHGRPVPPEYIGRAVTFLASEYFSRFTTGSVLTVDAGASLYGGRVPFDRPARNET